MTGPVPLPRPPLARPGAPAPWASLPDGARRGLSLERVLGALTGAGRDEGIPAAFPARFAFSGVPTSSAAVLVALFEEAGETRVLLTRRSANLRAHRGEIAFPGGRVEPGEEVVVAALREAHEEIGLVPGDVRPVGWLRPLSTFSSGTWITPVVAALPGRPATLPNPAEVARVFDVALTDLLRAGVFREERWSTPGRVVEGSADGFYPVYIYDVATETVWGATGRMLTDLLAVVTGVATT